MKSKRFARQFGRACGDFGICNNDGVDHFLVPLDRDIEHQMLLHWMYYKTTKMPNHFKITAIHFYDSDEPNAETVSCLNEFCEKRRNLPIIYRKVVKPANRVAYNTLLVETAVELGCNKIALPDSLDFLNCTIIRNMALDGCFNGLSIVEKVKLNESSPETMITRPFCYCTDEEIKKFGEAQNFQDKPTGIRLENEEFFEIAKKGLDMLKGESTNVEMNIFHSQFSIQKKYLMTGDGPAEEEDYID